MSDRPSLVVVRLTPSGRGAIATVAVEGPGALAAVEALFRSGRGRPLGSIPPGRPVFGHFGPEPGEEVVVRVRSGESVEVHFHGGHAAVAMVEQALVDQGCRPIAWQQWVRRRCKDPIAAAAWVALAEARTERTAAILLDQYHGALERAIAGIRESLGREEIAPAGAQIERLLARAPMGLHLVQPWRVLVAGPANVGKSSLVNAILGYARAIVDPTAGTTRDLVTATTAMDGWPVELSDTAGLRPSGHPVEQAGIALTQRSLATADLVLLVFDISQPWSAADQELLEDNPAALVIHNKSDLERTDLWPGSESSPLPLGEGPGVRAAGIEPLSSEGSGPLNALTPALSQGEREDWDAPQLPPTAPGRPTGMLTSALRRTGIEDVVRTISARLVPAPPAPGAAVPFTQEQVSALLRALQSLSVGEAASVRKALDWLTMEAG